MKQRLYIDTSVIGGCFDVEFEEYTKKLFERIRDKDFDIYVSEVSLNELIPAPEKVKKVFDEIPKDCLFNF